MISSEKGKQAGDADGALEQQGDFILASPNMDGGYGSLVSYEEKQNSHDLSELPKGQTAQRANSWSPAGQMSHPIFLSLDPRIGTCMETNFLTRSNFKAANSKD